MIANITHTSQAKPLINYNENKVEKGEAERIFYNGIDENGSKENVISEFSFATKASKRVDKNVHISLNFTPEDLEGKSNNDIIEIANDYLKELGYPDDQLKVMYRHFDTLHPHIHIVIPKIVNGKALNNTSNFRMSQKITRALEIKYNLHRVEKSIKNKAQTTSLESINDFISMTYTSPQEKVKSFNAFFKEFNRQHKPINFLEYKEQLQKFGIEVIENTKNDLLVGLSYKRLEVNEVPLKASLLYNSIPLKKIEKSFDYNKKTRTQRFESIVRKFNSINQKYDLISLEDLQKEFESINIKVEFVSKGNVINAYRFYDLEQNLYYKPSAIDRKISFSNIKDKVRDKSEKNKTYRNNSLLFILEREFKSKNDSKDSVELVQYLVDKGMVPIVRDSKIRFSHISIKNPIDKDYSKSLDIDISSINFSQISKQINNPNYKTNVYSSLGFKIEKNRYVPGNKVGTSIVNQLFQLILDVGATSISQRPVKLKTIKKMKL